MVKAIVVNEQDGLLNGKEYKVTDISMGQSYTSICLVNPKEGTKNSFNSVIFKFEEDNKELDIYSNLRFNPYLRRRN